MVEQHNCFFCDQPIEIDRYGSGYCRNHNGITIFHSISSAKIGDEVDFVSFDWKIYSVMYQVNKDDKKFALKVWTIESIFKAINGQDKSLFSLNDIGDTKPITPENAEEKIKTYLLFS
jgi:hypothetical protein